MSKLFSFRYDSSSLCFDLMPWQFQNMKDMSDVICHERWPKMLDLL